ncbi:MAG: helix-turn-helix domain-containing protein [Suipraeoptans sp.]
MTINNSKLQIALATACMNPYDLCKAVNIQYQTYRRISGGFNCKPATVGKIAKALNVPVENLIDMEGGD